MSHNLVEVEHFQMEGVMKDIASSIISLKDKIIAARALNGGWEAWLQVELALALVGPWSAAHSVFREQAIYDTDQKIDLWLKQHPRGQHDPYHSRIGVELKVESEFQVASLTARLKQDINKIKNGPHWHMQSFPGGITMYAIGITTLASDLKRYKEIAIETDVMISYVRLVVDPRLDQGSLFMIW